MSFIGELVKLCSRSFSNLLLFSEGNKGVICWSKLNDPLCVLFYLLPLLGPIIITWKEMTTLVLKNWSLGLGYEWFFACNFLLACHQCMVKTAPVATLKQVMGLLKKSREIQHAEFFTTKFSCHLCKGGNTCDFHRMLVMRHFRKIASSKAKNRPGSCGFRVFVPFCGVM